MILPCRSPLANPTAAPSHTQGYLDLIPHPSFPRALAEEREREGGAGRERREMSASVITAKREPREVNPNARNNLDNTIISSLVLSTLAVKRGLAYSLSLSRPQWTFVQERGLILVGQNDHELREQTSSSETSSSSPAVTISPSTSIDSFSGTRPSTIRHSNTRLRDTFLGSSPAIHTSRLEPNIHHARILQLPQLILLSTLSTYLQQPSHSNPISSTSTRRPLFHSGRLLLAFALR